METVYREYKTEDKETLFKKTEELCDKIRQSEKIHMTRSEKEAILSEIMYKNLKNKGYI